MFPKPFKIGGNTTVWDADEVEAWICDQKAGKPSAIASPPPAGRNPVKISTRPNAIRPGRPRKVIE
jgi:Prophage CP4-57 regulatory protein (AlpA)